MRSWALWWRLVPALLLAACSGPADKPRQVPLDLALAHLHALFVGIDHYRYSSAQVPEARFDDLQGAVGDVARFKAALEELYGVDLGKPEGKACASDNGVAITLVDACAPRKAILDALERQIARAKPGDTVLFYYAGHGAATKDTTDRDQDTGYHGTILGHDARKPGGSADEVGEIWDVELRQIKDRATAAGVFFVTIFDSCNSATATRDGSGGLSRSAPPPTTPPPVLAFNLTQGMARAEGGYWVHLAAAQDREDAKETVTQSRDGKALHAGVFTSALIDALRLPSLRHATFGDIIREVQLRVAEGGHTTQRPSAEGRLTASLGRRDAAPVLFEARGGGQSATMSAGSLSGVTTGSRFALYASQADAVAGKSPLAEAAVDKVEPDRAMLKVLSGSARGGGLPFGQLFAKETAHFLPPAQLAVSVADGPLQGRLTTALEAIAFARSDPAGTVRLAVASDNPLGAELRAADGTFLAGLGLVDAPEFAGILADELRKVARVQQLLALRTSVSASPDTASTVTPFAVTTCVATDADQGSCPALGTGELRRIGKGLKFAARLSNRGNRPSYLYLLAIDPRNAVTLVVPRRGEIDQPIGPRRSYGRSGIFTDLPGLYRFVAIASATPIRADAFEQSGNGTRGIDACASPLERLICSANDGQRDASVTSVGDWSAQVSTLLVTDGGTRE